MSVESRPPLRKTPTGTSLTWARTLSVMVSRTASVHRPVSQPLLPGHLVNQRSISTLPSCHLSRCPEAGSARLPTWFRTPAPNPTRLRGRGARDFATQEADQAKFGTDRQRRPPSPRNTAAMPIGRAPPPASASARPPGKRKHAAHPAAPLPPCARQQGAEHRGVARRESGPSFVRAVPGSCRSHH